MKQTRLIMDMPVIVEIVDEVKPEIFDKLFDYFYYVDNTFSTFKKTSEITRINDGLLKTLHASKDVQEILRLAKQTKSQTLGYFNIDRGGKIDPSGIVKGWAIHNAARLLGKIGIKNYYVEVGGDIEVTGHNSDGKLWTIGIRNPFNIRQIVKVVQLKNKGIATSGTYERGKHIYIPHTHMLADETLSLTVIGPNVYEADRYATAAFAMGKKGIAFIDSREGFEGYMIDTKGIATLTAGFEKYTA
jgi:thiamine biosynthesis lipoprotein